MSSDKQVYATGVSPERWATLSPTKRQMLELAYKYEDELFRSPIVHGVLAMNDRLVVHILPNTSYIAKYRLPQLLEGCKVGYVEQDRAIFGVNSDRIRPLQRAAVGV